MIDLADATGAVTQAEAVLHIPIFASNGSIASEGFLNQSVNGDTKRGGQT